MRVGKMAWHMLRHNGPVAFGAYAARKLNEAVFRPRCANAAMCADLVKDRRGVEIGGPSRIFGDMGHIPIYRHAAAVDGVNFAAETVWASALGEDHPFVYGGRTLGRQYVREASDLEDIPSSDYDFCLSSHVIEHLANPVRGLFEWVRVLKEDGFLILIAPHKDATFDHRRPVTKMAHIENDYARNRGEDDMTHIPEVLALHDFAKDWGAGDRDAFRSRCEDNFRTRCVHHHVFDTDLVIELVNFAGLKIRAVEHAWPNNIVVICQKKRADSVADNSQYVSGTVGWRQRSPFPTDKGE